MTTIAAAAARTRAVVVADLDGTLSLGRRPLVPELAAVLRRVADLPEARLVLASSRPLPEIHRLMGSLADDADLIACNGALRVSRTGGVSRTALSDVLVGELLTVLIDEAFRLDYGDRLVESSPGALSWMGTGHRSVLRRFGPQTGVLRVSTTTDRPYARLAQLVRGRAEVIRHGLRGHLEVVPLGINKVVALDLLMGEERAPVIALGTDTHDLGLLRSADHAAVAEKLTVALAALIPGS